MLVDIVLIIGSVIIVILGMKRGFISSVLGLVSWLAAAFCIAKFSTPIAEWIYSEFVREKLVDKVCTTLQNDYAFGTAQSQFSVFITNISKTLNTTSKLIGADVSNNLQSFDPSGMSLEQVAQNITDKYLATIAIQFCKWIVSIVGFFILIALFSFIGNSIAKVIKATPLKHVDKLFGAVTGVLKAAVMLIVFSALLQKTSGLIHGNSAIKSLCNDNSTTKVSNFATFVDESVVVTKINEKISFL